MKSTTTQGLGGLVGTTAKWTKQSSAIEISVLQGRKNTFFEGRPVVVTSTRISVPLKRMGKNQSQLWRQRHNTSLLSSPKDKGRDTMPFSITMQLTYIIPLTMACVRLHSCCQHHNLEYSLLRRSPGFKSFPSQLESVFASTAHPSQHEASYHLLMGHPPREIHHKP